MRRDLVVSGEASGDPELADQLVRLRGRLTPTTAAAVVDLEARPVVRVARVTTSRLRSRTAREAAADDNPRFELGSITKGLTGMLLAEAIARGELTLDTTAGEILDARSSGTAGTESPGTARAGTESPGTARASAESPAAARAGAESPAAGRAGADSQAAAGTVASDELRSVTMRELCTHTSGLPRLPLTAGTVGRVARLIALGLDPYRGQSPERVLALAGRQRLRGRGSYRYSNLGGAVAGQLLAIAAGTDYGPLLRERVLAPLRMTSSAIAIRGVTAHSGRSISGRRRQPWVLDGYAPAGGAISTIEDVARLIEALLDGSAPGARSLQPLPDAVPSGPGRQAAMFWIVERRGGDGATITGHNGATGGYSAFLGLQRDRRRGVAVLTDLARAADPRRIALALLDSVD